MNLNIQSENLISNYATLKFVDVIGSKVGSLQLMRLFVLVLLLLPQRSAYKRNIGKDCIKKTKQNFYVSGELVFLFFEMI